MTLSYYGAAAGGGDVMHKILITDEVASTSD